MRDISSQQRTFITKRNADDGSQAPRVLIKLQAGHTHHGSYSNSVLGIDNCCIQFQNQVQTSIILNMSATLFSKWHFVTLKETFEDSVLVAFHLNLTKLHLYMPELEYNVTSHETTSTSSSSEETMSITPSPSLLPPTLTSTLALES